MPCRLGVKSLQYCSLPHLQIIDCLCFIHYFSLLFFFYIRIFSKSSLTWFSFRRFLDSFNSKSLVALELTGLLMMCPNQLIRIEFEFIVITIVSPFRNFSISLLDIFLLSLSSVSTGPHISWIILLSKASFLQFLPNTLLRLYIQPPTFSFNIFTYFLEIFVYMLHF